MKTNQRRFTVTCKNNAYGETRIMGVELITPELTEACALARRKNDADANRYTGGTTKMAGVFWTVEDEHGQYYDPQTEQPA